MSHAVVATVADDISRIDYFIRYHLSVGFERIYLYFDDPQDPAIYVAQLYPQVYVQVMDEAWRQQSILFLSQFNPSDAAAYEDEVMIRQETNVRLTIELARKEQMQWLVHIDSDELFYTREIHIQAHFEKLNQKQIKNVIYRNLEALIHSRPNTKPFNRRIYFKKNYFKNNVWEFSSQQREFLQAHQIKPEYYFHFYQNGKSAVHLSAEITIDSVHFFNTEQEPTAEWHQDDTCILHFPCPTLDSFIKKYERLGDFSDLWRGEPRAGDFISLLHLQARDTYLSGDKALLATLFEQKIALDDVNLIHALEDHDLLCQIDDVEHKVYPGDYLISQGSQQRAPLLQACIQAITSLEPRDLMKRIQHDFCQRFQRLCEIAETLCGECAPQLISDGLHVILTKAAQGQWREATSHHDLRQNYYIGGSVYLDFIVNHETVLFANIDYLHQLGVNYIQVYRVPGSDGVAPQLLTQAVAYCHQYQMCLCLCLELADMTTTPPMVRFTTICDEVFAALAHQPDWVQLTVHQEDALSSLYGELIHLLAEIYQPGTSVIWHEHAIPRIFQSPTGVSLPVHHRPGLTAALWYSLMSMETSLLQAQTRQFPLLDRHAAWLNQVNDSHGIVWTFNDRLIAETQEQDVEAFYRKVHHFYLNRHDQYFPIGCESFQRHLLGSTASLAGLLKAVNTHNPAGIERSIQRILLMYAVTFSIGGLPVLLLGDESFPYQVSERCRYQAEDIHHVYDFYRQCNDEDCTSKAVATSHTSNRLYTGLNQLIQARKSLAELSGHDVDFVTSLDKSHLIFLRKSQKNTFLFLGNFSPIKKRLRLDQSHHELMSALWMDMLQNHDQFMHLPSHLEPYQYYWLRFSQS
ncbi:glycosyltransferase family 2 protein [Vibrio sp. MEBiC08052]|uniref:glycosyltransferase family 2 protein n=1 Tax=Vibrio sp. MEBiC08052 TaxID=1761910 RepID=UPI0007408761|nr:glycosyltransferase family 2 protein [Vibrio sp. MEBiC08052]KUI97006.1 hypothetical protein VRK_38610 [Vibrio sp. MEBiC08052]